MRSATYAWVLDQFCHQWFWLEIDVTAPAPSLAS
jgi:hypothetical protein